MGLALRKLLESGRLVDRLKIGVYLLTGNLLWCIITFDGKLLEYNYPLLLTVKLFD